MAILEAASKVKQDDVVADEGKKETENPPENVPEKRDDLLDVHFIFNIFSSDDNLEINRWMFQLRTKNRKTTIPLQKSRTRICLTLILVRA